VPDSLIDAAGLNASAEDFLAAVLETTEQPIWAVDRDGVIRFANPAAITALRYDSVNQLVGRGGHEAVHVGPSHGSSHPAAECRLLLPRVTGETVRSDLDWFVRRDGSMFPVSYVSVPIELREGRGAAVFFTDIEGRLRAEQVLREHETSREELARLADEQAALRRVATLVARERPPAEIFAAVAEEVGQLLRVQDTTIFRYEDDWTATAVADRGDRDVPMSPGTRISLEGESATARVRRTALPARVDDFSNAAGPLAQYTRRAGIGSTVGSPIVVDGRVWGAMIAATRSADPMPPDTEARMEKFTELVATAISNVQARSDLAASRARIAAAADEERRRVVRDLHDGAQQRLVHTVVTLKLAREELKDDQRPGAALVREALAHAQGAIDELRELTHGILPAVLTGGGLRAGVDALASRMPVHINHDVCADRFPVAVEATAYFVVAESLTNVAKHAGATGAVVTARIEQGALRVRVQDDGVGGARPDGSGLVGLADRLAALDGHLRVETPAVGGTLVLADIPLGRHVRSP
jgi:PAS domain S-box-containing protein